MTDSKVADLEDALREFQAYGIQSFPQGPNVPIMLNSTIQELQSLEWEYHFCPDHKGDSEGTIGELIPTFMSLFASTLAVLDSNRVADLAVVAWQISDYYRPSLDDQLDGLIEHVREHDNEEEE